MRVYMTAPRRVLARATVMITRRCLARMFLLKPSKAANELFAYLLAVAARRHGVLLHAYCVLSNHFHCVLTDPEGKLPAFEQYLDSLVARSFNALHGRWETFWAPGSYSAVSLLTPADILAKMAYVLANPIISGLVRAAREWPGLWSAPEAIGGPPVRALRPRGFFRENGPMPESEELELVCPPGFDSVDELRARLSAAVKHEEGEALRRLAAQGRSVLGVRGVLAQRIEARPASVEPRRNLNPHVACRDRWKRIEALQGLKAFRAAYRLAWRQFRRGLRATIFPHGTYWMRVAYGAVCASG